MYSPKISKDLVRVIYKIGQYEGLPMTKVVDRLLRDSVRDYINNIEDEDIADTVFYRNNCLTGRHTEHSRDDDEEDPDGRRRCS